MKGDLLHNGSNYVDRTAYQAIQNVMKGEKTMEKKVGQVWKIKQNNGLDAEVLILAVHDGYCTTVQVKDAYNGHLIKGTSKTTELGKMSYTFDNAFVKYKESVSEYSLDDVKQSIADMLGIHINVEPAPIPAQVEVTDDLKIKIASVTAERDVYKSLFEKFMGKLQ